MRPSQNIDPVHYAGSAIQLGLKKNPAVNELSSNGLELSGAVESLNLSSHNLKLNTNPIFRQPSASAPAICYVALLKLQGLERPDRKPGFSDIF